LELKGKKTHRGENYIMMNFTACVLHRMEVRGVYRVLVGRPEGKETTGKTYA
jgi:hypothetical protein